MVNGKIVRVAHVFIDIYRPICRQSHVQCMGRTRREGCWKRRKRRTRKSACNLGKWRGAVIGS